MMGASVKEGTFGEETAVEYSKCSIYSENIESLTSYKKNNEIYENFLYSQHNNFALITFIHCGILMFMFKLMNV